MKVMVFVKATAESEAGVLPSQQLLTDMMQYNEELVKAGILLAGDGLKPSSQGFRVQFSGKNRTVVDGPFAETKELVAGYWLWQVKSIEEAIEWVKRCPNPMSEDSEIEIRPVYEAEDFGEAFTPELQAQSERIFQRTQQANAGALEPARFEQYGEILIAGLNQRYGMNNRADIPAQWDRFLSRSEQLKSRIGKDHFGVCWNYDAKTCEFDYLTGVEIPAADAVPAGFTRLKIAPQRYAVFIHPGHVSSIAQTIDAIWTNWLPNSGHSAVDAPSFERYTEAFDPKLGAGGTEIWVPVKA